MTNLNSSIEWTDTTWNPVSGCTKVSPGCDNCYAEKITERFHGKGSFAVVARHGERLYEPLRWRKPRRVFVNSMSDLFHDDVPRTFIAHIFSVMARAKLHTFQVLTKRHGRMHSLLTDPSFAELVSSYVGPDAVLVWPLPNVWVGVSVENQRWADIRVPVLVDTPAAVRFLSCEPLLGPIDLYEGLRSSLTVEMRREWQLAVDWVIVGGESGPGARPMHPDWARSIRDQCVEAEIAFLFKQWGAWAPLKQLPPDTDVTPRTRRSVVAGKNVFCVGKKRAGREIDGRTWDQFPAGSGVTRHAR